MGALVLAGVVAVTAFGEFQEHLTKEYVRLISEGESITGIVLWRSIAHWGLRAEWLRRDETVRVVLSYPDIDGHSRQHSERWTASDAARYRDGDPVQLYRHPGNTFIRVASVHQRRMKMLKGLSSGMTTP